MTSSQTKTKNNKHRIILLITIALVVSALICTAVFGTVFFWNRLKSRTPQVSQTRNLNRVTFPIITENLPFGLTQLELATTPELKEQGLMFREELCPTCGMLFVYGVADSRTFWMKNTLISLDIIFLDSNFRVINIASNTETNQTGQLYSSTEPAQYVLEVSANWATEKKITKGSIIDLKNNI